MKIRRIIYLVLGILFILIDLLVTLINLKQIIANFSDVAYGIGYFMGSQLLLYIGLAFLYGSRRVKQKIEGKKLLELENSFMQGGEGQ